MRWRHELCDRKTGFDRFFYQCIIKPDDDPILAQIKIRPVYQGRRP